MQSIKKGFSPLSSILEDYRKGDDKYISREFQQYGYDLANELGDLKHTSLYIKLAKVTPRWRLESARSFIKDASNVKNKPAMFLWKIKELKNKKLLENKRIKNN